jgi:DUF971 family protein
MPADLKTEVRSADLSANGEALEILWGDEHRSSYPLKYLRSECPCAQCRSERDQAKANPFRMITAIPSGEMTGAEAVGRYALKFRWADGHDAGIYTYELLREICPCEVCRAVRKKDDAPFVHGIYIPGAGRAE